MQNTEIKHGGPDDILELLIPHAWGHTASRLVVQGKKFIIAQDDLYWSLTFPIVRSVLTIYRNNFLYV